MSQPNSANPQFTEVAQPPAGQTMPVQAPAAPREKQRLNVYTVMLIISFFALTIGTLLLYLELTKWGDGPRYWDTTGSQPQISSVAPLHPGSHVA